MSTPRSHFGIFIVILGVVLAGMITSPMTNTTKMVVSGGLLLLGFAAFYLGVEYGSTRQLSS
ncbi:DUF7333 family protein [Haladaptatus salinisoli]|uniref:DUF7333 family protein n=1 Tax=Haladaptatus salinisoli TaxID=2884876 RepID=UPI003F5E8EED